MGHQDFLNKGNALFRPRDPNKETLPFEKGNRIAEKNGAVEGIRTPDPVITNDVLYRLSYNGVKNCRKLDTGFK